MRKYWREPGSDCSGGLLGSPQAPLTAGVVADIPGRVLGMHRVKPRIHPCAYRGNQGSLKSFCLKLRTFFRSSRRTIEMSESGGFPHGTATGLRLLKPPALRCSCSRRVLSVTQNFALGCTIRRPSRDAATRVGVSCSGGLTPTLQLHNSREGAAAGLEPQSLRRRCERVADSGDTTGRHARYRSGTPPKQSVARPLAVIGDAS